jgi:hypothetical protein
MKYAVVASRDGKVFRTFGPLDKNGALRFKRTLLKQEHAEPYKGVLSLSVVQCWPVVDNESAPDGEI